MAAVIPLVPEGLGGTTTSRSAPGRSTRQGVEPADRDRPGDDHVDRPVIGFPGRVDQLDLWAQMAGQRRPGDVLGEQQDTRAGRQGPGHRG